MDLYFYQYKDGKFKQISSFKNKQGYSVAYPQHPEGSFYIVINNEKVGMDRIEVAGMYNKETRFSTNVWHMHFKNGEGLFFSVSKNGRVKQVTLGSFPISKHLCKEVEDGIDYEEVKEVFLMEGVVGAIKYMNKLFGDICQAFLDPKIKEGKKK